MPRRDLVGACVTRVHVPQHTGARVVGEHPLDLGGGERGASATVTCPACSDRPIPTPPPWWMETQLAPLAVLTNALSSGQSAIASDPSAIASVSR